MWSRLNHRYVLLVLAILQCAPAMHFHYNTGRFKTLEYALKGLRAPFFRMRNQAKKTSFVCPICSYVGPFMNKAERLDCKCPRCGELERSRLHYLLLQRLFSTAQLAGLSVLHIAPENALRKYLRRRAGGYVFADLHRTDVDFRFDVQDIPFASASFDLVFASHVLQYPENDVLAMREIRRLLRADGQAILPVPVLHQTTLDHSVRASNRMMHEPGMDYFDRLRGVFSTVQVFSPQHFAAKHQLQVLVDTPDLCAQRRAFLRTALNLAPVCRV